MGNSEERNTTKEILVAVENYFRREETVYRPFDERGMARAIYSVRSKFRHVEVLFQAYEDMLILRSVIPINAGEEERAKVGEFVLRTNYGLKIGGFDYDLDEGRISYRVSIYCGEEEFSPPTHEQIDSALIISLSMIDKYGDALLKVLFGLAEPEDAIEAAEEDE